MTLQEHPIELSSTLELAKELSLLDKDRLVERMMPQIEDGLASATKKPKLSLLGICINLGTVRSTETIDEARREAWVNFPREVA